MISKNEYTEICKRTCDYFKKANIALTEKEKREIEVADFGLNDINNIGLQLVVYVNNDRYCAKEMVLFPNQICPEHKHPNINSKLGKQETFRCRYGKVYLYVEGVKSNNLHCKIPDKYKDSFTVFHEIILNPGEQYTIEPNTLHWFQADEEGAIISEFSSHSDDLSDIFTDKRIKRIPEIGE